MLHLLSECHFWTSRDEIRIKDTDYGAFKYLRNRDYDPENILQQAKREYAENRDCQVILKNNKTSRLKDNVKKLDELLQTQKIIHSEWRTGSVLLILFASGVIVHISVDIYVGDILCMTYDKFLIGKLAADVITDAIFTRQHIVLAYNTNQVTVLHLQKPNEQPAVPEKIANMDPKIFHVLIPGASERKLPRKLAVNSSYDLIAIWTKSSQNEVFPWRPTVRDQDRANIHVFKLNNVRFELFSYCWSENDPLRVDFLRSSGSLIFIIEEKISRKGEVSAEVCSYELSEGKMQRVVITSIPMGTQICCFEFSPDQEKLFLGTIDSYVCIHDLVRQTSKFLPKIEIIPTECSWHADSSLIMVANDRGQFQCFDIALQPIANQLISDDVTPLNLLDLSHYFTIQPLLLGMSFSCKPELLNFPFPFAQTDCFLLLIFENGPLVCVKFVCGAGMAGDIHNSGLTADVLLDRYLTMGQLEKAVNLLQAMNWETYGAMCLISLHKVANFVFTQKELKRNRLELLTKALKTFTDGLSEETKDEFGDQVYDIKRRMFFFLLRNNLFQEAFNAAQDVEDYDLFMDLFQATRSNPEYNELSQEAYAQAEILFDESLSASSESDSTCSESSNSESNYQKDKKQVIVSSHRVMGQWKHEKAVSTLKNYVPPLPSLKSKIFNAENIKINIPKPELRVSMSADPMAPSISRTATLARAHKAALSPQLELRLPDLNAPSTSKTAMLRNVEYANHMESNRWSIQTHKSSNLELKVVDPDVPCTSKPATLIRNPQTSENHREYKLPEAYQSTGDYSEEQEEAYMTRLNFGRGIQTIPPLPDMRHLQISSADEAWTQVPDQTLGIPMISNAPTHPYMPSTSHNILPRASTHVPAVDTTPRVPDNNQFHPRFYEHPLVSGTIPPTTMFTPIDELPARLPIRKPTASILSNGSSLMSNTNGSNINAINGTLPPKKDPAEKNKVKFSDTVQVAVVPEIPRKEKALPPKRNGYVRPRNLTNPKKELADSLPLCHPHDDYLKDFDPLPEESLPQLSKVSPAKDSSSPEETKSNPSIKVVHFGIV